MSYIFVFYLKMAKKLKAKYLWPILQNKNLMTLFILFFSINAKAIQICEGYLTKNHYVSINAAIKNGISLYNQTQDPYQYFSDVYFHATNVSTVTNIVGPDWIGNPIANYAALKDFSSLYPKASVTHAFLKEAAPISPRQIVYSKLYAQQSARRAFLAQELFIPSNLLHQPFVFEILEFINDKQAVSEILSETKFFDTTPSLNKLTKMSELEWNEFLNKLYALKGVLIIIDGNVGETQPIERDPEIQESNSVIIISPTGLPVSKIIAIIPLSDFERNELQKLIE